MWLKDEKFIQIHNVLSSKAEEFPYRFSINFKGGN